MKNLGPWSPGLRNFKEFSKFKVHNSKCFFLLKDHTTFKDLNKKNSNSNCIQRFRKA